MALPPHLLNFNTLMKSPRFNKRNAHTLLFVTGTKTFRVDVDKAGILLDAGEMLTIGCTNPAKLADCVGLIAGNNQPLGRKVWLLYAGLPMNVLSLPSMQIAGADEATLIQALQFELEGMTGNSHQDMQLAYQLLSNKDEMSSYWVSEINQLHFEDIGNALKKTGSRLGGLLHPAGLPCSLGNTGQTDWLRLESWPNQVAAFRNDPANGFDIRLFALDSRQWQDRLAQWLAAQGGVGQSETLQSFWNNKLELLPETRVIKHLNDDEAIAEWLGLWAAALVNKTPPAVPVLHHQSNLNQNLVLMASGGIIAAVICAGHLSWHLYQANFYTAELEALQKTQTTMTTMRKALTDDRAKRDKLLADNAKLKGDTETLPTLIKNIQRRPSQLLEALAKGRTENLLVERIDADKDAVKISGVTLDATSANALSNYLEQQLATLGWAFMAPAKKNLELFAEGGPWEFEITLLDSGAAGFNDKPKDKQ